MLFAVVIIADLNVNDTNTASISNPWNFLQMTVALNVSTCITGFRHVDKNSQQLTRFLC